MQFSLWTVIMLEMSLTQRIMWCREMWFNTSFESRGYTWKALIYFICVNLFGWVPKWVSWRRCWRNESIKWINKMWFLCLYYMKKTIYLEKADFFFMHRREYYWIIRPRWKKDTVWFWIRYCSWYSEDKW